MRGKQILLGRAGDEMEPSGVLKVLICCKSPAREPAVCNVHIPLYMKLIIYRYLETKKIYL